MCYFSSGCPAWLKRLDLAMNCILLLSSLCICMLCPGTAQAQGTASSSEAQGHDGIAAGQDPATVLPNPNSAMPAPPPVPERKQPVVPLVLSSKGSAFTQPKQSLAWRHKAMKLSLDKFNQQSGDKQGNSLQRCFSSNYSDTLMALASACASCGFKVDSINSNAGEVLASNNDGSCRLVFSAWEQAEGKSFISAGIDRGSTAGAKAAALILNATGNIVSKRGRI